MFYLINVTIRFFLSFVYVSWVSYAKGPTILQITLLANIGVPSHIYLSCFVFVFKMSKITISSLNVRGLVNNEKRREVFHWLKKKKFSIYLLQEAHCTEKSSEIWAAEWGYTALFSSLASNKVGVAVLFNNNFPFKISRQLCDKGADTSLLIWKLES